MATLLITALVGLVIPALVALVTKEALPTKVKALLLLLFSTASGVVAGLAATPPHSWTEWQAVLVSILVTFVSAAASDVAAWRPTGGTAAVTRATERFGFGPRSPHSLP
jgi:hypothetical protein